LTFVPDGEPTLDVNLGREIELCKPLGIKIAVISNGSLIWKEDVRSDLLGSDWVSLKVDAVSEEIWRKVNRPHGMLKLDEILEGMSIYKRIFNGELTTETMLVRGVNDTLDEMEKVAYFLEELNPDKAYIAIPTRPPAEAWVEPAEEEAVNRIYQIFNARLKNVEYLIGFEGNAFAFTGDVVDDLLNITSVHPMREESVKELLSRAKTSWDIVERLIEEKKLIELHYMGNRFFMRKLPSHMSEISRN
jgi:wyosine [tRNA(Phe)-imidazoG37] synthetase (radical SAM superfamily)